MLDKGVSVGLCACSNALSDDSRDMVHELEYSLYDVGLNVVSNDNLYGEFSGKERALMLNDMFADEKIKAIFDVSGGDAANEVLPFLDYKLIGDSDKTFYGYSDLTAVINAIYAKSDKISCLYNVRNLIYEHKEKQMADFEMTVIDDEEDLYDFDYDFVRGDRMKGIVIGGNVRCFLKLAGTEYMPSFRRRILFLEAMSGNHIKISSYFNQLAQMGVFNEVEGVLLGTFLELEKEGKITAVELLKQVCTDKNMPIAVTDDIGHRADSKAIYIGKELELS